MEQESPEDEVFLSDLSKDPGETTNLADKMPELAAELQEKALAWRAGIEKTWEEKFAGEYRSLS